MIRDGCNREDLVKVECERFGQALTFAQQGQCAAVVPNIALDEGDKLKVLCELPPTQPQLVCLYATISNLGSDSDMFLV
jgi:hypothetical protein